MAEKNKFWQEKKKLQERYDLPYQGKFWSAVTQQQIKLESCSNPLQIRE